MPEPPAISSSGRLVASPGEVAADRAPQLELVARAKLLGEVGRDLAVVDPLDRQRDAGVLRRRGDRVGALRLVAVIGGKADVDVLAGACPGHPGTSSTMVLRMRASRRSAVTVPTATPPPARAGSVAPIALLLPGVAVVVVAVALPEAGLVVVVEPMPAHPLGALPEVQVRDEQPRRPAVLAARAARRRTRTRSTPCPPMRSASGTFVV